VTSGAHRLRLGIRRSDLKQLRSPSALPLDLSSTGLSRPSIRALLPSDPTLRLPALALDPLVRCTPHTRSSSSSSSSSSSASPTMASPPSVPATSPRPPFLPTFSAILLTGAQIRVHGGPRLPARRHCASRLTSPARADLTTDTGRRPGGASQEVQRRWAQPRRAHRQGRLQVRRARRQARLLRVRAPRPVSRAR
jgi:hypothetical protein